MDYEFESVDYEDMDDLALSDHIEYNHHQPEVFAMDAHDTVNGN